MGIKKKHLKAWLRELTRGKYPDTEHWDKLMSVTKLVLRIRHIPEALVWTMMVLIPKSGGDYIGIGIVEVMWKVHTSIVSNILRNSITLHDSLHGFRQGRGAAMATMEENLEQQLAGIVYEPLFKVFIDVRKSHNSLDVGICLEMMRGVWPWTKSTEVNTAILGLPE